LSYFAQKCIKFHLQPSRFQKFSSGRKSQTYAYRGGGGNKGFLPVKEGDVERTGKKKDGRGRASCRGILLQGFRGETPLPTFREACSK